MELGLIARKLIHYLASMTACLALSFAASAAQSGQDASNPTSEVVAFIKTLDSDHDSTLRYSLIFWDLNDDGHPEAIVRLISQNWCGSGGCKTYILSKRNGAWQVITEISVTQVPIYVLPEKSKGWHNIAVRVQGGGITPGYFAELRFDGKTYPRNPTRGAARPLSGSPHGAVVLGSERDAQLVYHDGARELTGLPSER